MTIDIDIADDALIDEEPSVHFETHVRIRDEARNIISPKQNVLQRRIDAYFMRCWERDRPCRGIVVKSRKRGASTQISHLHYWASRVRGYSAGLVGHVKLSSTKTLADMFQQFWDTDTYDWGQVQTVCSSQAMKWDNGAEVLRFTDQNPDAIRSATINLCHSTETAYYANSEVTLDAAINAIGHHGFSSLWLESTPAGMAGAFPTKYIEEARWPRADECPDGRIWWRPFEAELKDPDLSAVDAANTFVRIFSAWFEHEEFFNHLGADEQRHVEATLDSEPWFVGERELIDRYGNQGPQGLRLGYEVVGHTVWEQLAWRRNTLLNYCRKDRTRMGREYAAGPLDGFRSSGLMYFDREAVAVLERRAGTVQARPVTLVHRVSDNTVQPHVTLDEDAMFRIYEEPVVGCRYLVAADPMRGVDQHLKSVSGKQKEGQPDRHGVGVLRDVYRDAEGAIHRPALVAVVRPPCYLPLHVLARWIGYLSIYYGRALVVPETNAHGLALVYKLEPFKVPIFSMPREDARTGKTTAGQTPTGWVTTTTTRPMILDALARAVFDDELDVWDTDVIAELRTMVTNLKTGKIEADTGAKDDLVLMLAIGYFNLRSATVYELPRTPRKPVSPELRAMEAALGRQAPAVDANRN